MLVGPSSHLAARLCRALAVMAMASALAAPAAAHPTPFTYLDVSIGQEATAVTLVAHVFDIAHDLGVEPPARFLEPAYARSETGRIVGLLQPRFALEVDGQPMKCVASDAIELFPERQSIKLSFACPMARPATLIVRAHMFPYDPVHQTFVNIYENQTLTLQAILDREHTTYEYFTGSRQGIFAVVRKFIASGVHHILIGPDHLLFLVGLLLLGGPVRRLLLVVTAFTVAHSVTLSLAALNIFTPPARFIEPAIALSIVYVGADNLLVKQGRDMRAWIAFAFGFIHGFGFANVLREMDLPRQALGWTLFSFNLGVEIGQLGVVIVVATALAAVRAYSERAGRRLVFGGSVVVMAAGAFWFVQRVFLTS